jgi:ABC-type molybdenum transport system ATPase subunit/photorepair protein PhrA
MQRLIDIRDADVYIGGKKILSGISWKLRAGENWAVLGRNGSGKTTFLKLVIGELNPALGGSASSAWRFGEKSIWEVKKKIGYLSAEFQAGYDRDLKLKEVVLSGFFSSVGLYEKPAERQVKKAREWMEFFGLRNLAGKNANEVSYGEFRKALIARAMVKDPRVLLLDEPCAGLDAPSRAEFLQTLNRVSEKGVSLVFVTHRLEDLPSSITHILILEKGLVIFNGKKQALPAAG